jgi:hypothetical protein
MRGVKLLRRGQINHDKPHRCPGCHGIAERAWSHRGYGPRTIFRCPRDCGLVWRASVRGKRYRP